MNNTTSSMVAVLTALVGVAAFAAPKPAAPAPAAAAPAAAAPAAAAPAAAAPAPTDGEQVAGLQKMCADNAPAIQKRQAEKSLFERLGKEPKIRSMAEQIFAAHSKNPTIGRLFTKVNKEAFVKNVTDFLVVGTGGKADYKGRDMGAAHKELKITNGDFLAAGGDVQAVMKGMKYGENEIQEIVCALTAFVPVVVVSP